MNRRLIMGTAGHIDHGKTRLIKLLTGVDCDRLPEEKARGITIELGFTHLRLPSETIVGVIDVPGHERFVRNMVAGAGGIDFVLLVIAADEGVMPQTREHFAVCRQLGIAHGLIALTKTDMVDEEMLELAREDVELLVADSFLEGAPIVPVSSQTGEGKQELLTALDEIAAAVVGRSDSGILRLPIDRVFTMKGFGTVVTGTTVGGRIGVGDVVALLPGDLTAKVRGLQVHGDKVDVAYAGQRTAVNLQGVAVDQVQRGQMLAAPALLAPTYMIDAEIVLEADAPRPLKMRSLVRLHSFTREVMAHVIPLDREQIEPGEGGKVQLRLRASVVTLPGDRFVMRSYSPIATIGGGIVLHSHPRKHRRPYTQALADLEALRGDDLLEKMMVHYRHAGRGGVALAHLGPMLGVAEKALREAFNLLLSRQRVVRVDKEADLAVDVEALAELQNDLLKLLADFHKAEPTQPGLSRAELNARASKGAAPKVLQRALNDLVGDGRVVMEGSVARLATHSATADKQLQEVRDRLQQTIEQAGFSAPTRKDLEAEVDDGKMLDKALGMLVRGGQVVRVGETLYFAADALANAERMLIDYLSEHGEIDAQGMKTLFGVSRKWSIPLAEYFDAAKLTLRVGDKRVLRRKE